MIKKKNIIQRAKGHIKDAEVRNEDKILVDRIPIPEERKFYKHVSIMIKYKNNYMFDSGVFRIMIPKTKSIIYNIHKYYGSLSSTFVIQLTQYNKIIFNEINKKSNDLIGYLFGSIIKFDVENCSGIYEGDLLIKVLSKNIPCVIFNEGDRLFFVFLFSMKDKDYIVIFTDNELFNKLGVFFYFPIDENLLDLNVEINNTKVFISLSNDVINVKI